MLGAPLMQGAAENDDAAAAARLSTAKAVAPTSAAAAAVHAPAAAALATRATTSPLHSENDYASLTAWVGGGHSSSPALQAIACSSQMIDADTAHLLDLEAEVRGSGRAASSWLPFQWVGSAIARDNRGINTEAVTSVRSFVPAAALSVLSVVLGIIIGHWIVPPPLQPPPPSLSAADDSQFGKARPLTKLDHPMVILVSSDGFRFGYNLKTPTPNIDRIREQGTWAGKGMLPVYPSVTFPNHYSIATGLHPAWHGIIDNQFHDLNNTSDVFTTANLDPHWWLGEPIWETATRQGVQAANMFWVGSEVERTHWKCPHAYCYHYNASKPYDERVDAVLAWVDLPPNLRPSLITLYFEEPDHSGHLGGPDTPAVVAAVARVDSAIQRLLDGLEFRHVLDDVNVILVSDHGMASVCSERSVMLERLQPFVSGFERSWLDFSFTWVGIIPPLNADVDDVMAGIASGLASGSVANAHAVRFYKKSELPERLHLGSSNRVPPIVGLVDEGYAAVFDKSDLWSTCAGMHGYDNTAASMRAVFAARGPRFASGRVLSSPIQNVEVYNIMALILGIEPAPNNGSLNFAKSVLLPKR